MEEALVRFYTGSVDNYLAGVAKGDFKNGIFFSNEEGNFTIWKDGNLYGTATGGSGVSQEWVDNKYGGAFVEILEDKTSEGFIFSFVDVKGDSQYSISIPTATFEKMGLMSAGDKYKLDNIESENIVYKEEGKGLSSNDFTDEHKELLDTVTPNAEPNILEVVKIDGVALENIDKSVNIDLADRVNELVGDRISSVYTYKGSVDNISELPANAVKGDVWNITNETEYGPAGVNVAWTGNEWDSLGGTLSTVNVTTEINEIKQDLTDLTERVDDLEGNYGRVTVLEQAVNTLNSDDSVEGSVANTATNIATTIIEQILTWQTI